MHTIHTTPGFIIGSRPYGDAGKILSIFTRDFGLVYATAQGIRYEKSKLRYYIQDYSFGIYSLVQGREFWRVTGAGSNDQCSMTNVQLGAKELIARIALLLRRLLHGEDAHPELFDHVIECAKFVSLNNLAFNNLNAGEMQTLESLIVARILHTLGYIGNVVGLNDQLKSIELNDELLHQLEDKRAILNHHINKALKESML